MASVASIETLRVARGAQHSLARAVLVQLRRIFGRLSRAGIPFCILRNRDRIPDQLIEGSDVDVIVPPSAGAKKLVSLLADLRPVQVVVHRSTIEMYFRVGPIFLHVDLLISDRQWRGARYLTNDEILAGTWDDQGMPVASLAHQAFCAWFSNLTRRRRFKTRYIPLIERAARESPEQLYSLLKKTFGQRLGRKLWHLIANRQLDQSDKYATQLRRTIWWRALCRRPFDTLFGAMHHGWSEFKQYLWPSGLNISVIGPDGAGKSAVCAALTNARRSELPFRNVEACHLYRRVLPMLSELRKGRIRRTPAAPATVHDPHGKRPHHPLLSMFTLSYFALDQWLSRIRWSWSRLSKNTLLIQDRHLAEVLVDPKRFRYGGPGWFARCVVAMIPKPDLIILLDAPEQILHGRKQEVPLAETARQRMAYQAMVASSHRGRTVDASRSMEEVADQVKETILKHLAERTSQWFFSGALR